MRTAFIAGLFSILAGALSAQVPGYLGKRFGAGYQFGFFVHPYIIVKTDVYSTGTTLPVKHTLFIDLTTGRKANVDLSYSFFMNNCMFNAESGLSTPNNIQANSFTFTPTVKEQRVIMHFTEISLNLFRSKFIAPLGWYHILKFGAFFGELKGGNQMKGTAQTSNGISVTSMPATIYGEDIYSGFRLGYGMGQRRMAGKNLYIKYSAIIHGFVGEFFAWVPGGGSSITRDYIGALIGTHIRMSNRYEINFALGYLIF